ncbi:T9SS type A sorting domain-containing protein [Aquirufa sp. A-Brett2-W8]
MKTKISIFRCHINIINIQKTKIVVLFLFVFGLITAKAQEAVIAAGGNASGSTGTVAYSVGQIVYTTNIGTNGLVVQGVQQPYIISVVLGVELHTIQLDFTVYPNPTNNFLTLNVGNAELSTLNFQLYDLRGILIESRKILRNTETISMENLPSALYFLRVTNNNQDLKTFKIIKY